MVTAFVDMVGLLMVIPLLPYVATDLGGNAFVVGLLVSSFSLAQLLSAPLWGRFSDRYGRRPALLIGLGAAAVAYVIFAYADTLWLLMASRVVQGMGGGTVGVLQAYVTDATEPKDRAKSFGWLSAATNVGVMIGPALGSAALALGKPAPGLMAAALCAVNMAFAWAYLRESHVDAPDPATPQPPQRRTRAAVEHVLRHPREPAPRLIWIYAIGMGAFMGFTAILALFLKDEFGVTEGRIWIVFTFNGAISVVARALLLGWMVDRVGEARLSRLGQTLLATGLALLPLTALVGPEATAGGASLRLVALALVIALVPLGTAFTFPCVTAMLSRVIDPRERGTIMGVQQSFGGAARVIFPLWAGWAYDRWTAAPFLTSAVMVLGTLALGLGIDAYVRETAAPTPAA